MAVLLLGACIAREEGGGVISPEAALAANDTEPVDLWIHLPTEPLEPAALPPTVTSFELSDEGETTYAVNGRAVTADELRAQAAEVRGKLDAAVRSQLAARRNRFDRFIAEEGLEDWVTARGATGFRVRVPRGQARPLAARLQDRAEVIAAPRRVRENLYTKPGHVGALDAIGVRPFAHGYGMRGLGIGVWLNEPYPPNLAHRGLSNADVRLLTGTHLQPAALGESCSHFSECCSYNCDEGVCAPSFPDSCTHCRNPDTATCDAITRGDEHSTAVTLALHATAPQATIYHALDDEDCFIYPGWMDPPGNGPPIYAGSMSFGWIDDYDSAYVNPYAGICNREWDNFILASRVAMFHATGNKIGFAASPGRGYNLVSVGMSNHVTGSLTAAFGWLNPATGVDKPEIVSPGVDIEFYPGQFAGGSSIATPIAAGFAADLMSGSPYYLNAPQAVKAHLIAGAKNVDGPVGISNADGAGQIDYLNTYFYRWGKTWNGGNNAYFVNDVIEETRTLIAGRRYRIAIAWLADGTTAETTGGLNMKMKLQVVGFRTLYEGYRPANNFQLIDMVAPASGEWTLRIIRTANTGQGGVHLSLTVGEMQGPAWTCNPLQYGRGDGCQCGCGILDPDCSSANACP